MRRRRRAFLYLCFCSFDCIGDYSLRGVKSTYARYVNQHGNARRYDSYCSHNYDLAHDRRYAQHLLIDFKYAYAYMMLFSIGFIGFNFGYPQEPVEPWTTWILWP